MEEAEASQNSELLAVGGMYDYNSTAARGLVTLHR